MASEVELEIQDCFNTNTSFILDAGAGSGKTWTLIESLRYSLKMNSEDFKKKNKRIACITYTNVAKNEIIERTEKNELIFVGTIHDFLWHQIKKFQKELKIKFIELINERLEKQQEILDSCTPRAVKKRENATERISKYQAAITVLNSSNISITYDNILNYSEGKFSHDELIIIAEKIFSSYPRIRKITTDSFPIILVDEYQDTQKETVMILLDYLLDLPNIIIGFFGDKMQQIYETGIGQIPETYHLRRITKNDNYRCSIKVIELLNKIRNDIQQIPSGNNLDGSAVFYNISNSENLDAFVQRELIINHSWVDSKTKRLYLTHNLIASKNNFASLFNLYKTRRDCLIKNEDNRGLCPFVDYLFDVEQIYREFTSKRIQSFLKLIQYKITSFESKHNLIEIMSNISNLRNSCTIGEYIDYVSENNILSYSQRMAEYDLEDETKKEHYDELMKINFIEFVRLYDTQLDNSAYSTKHGTKGAEYENVLVIIDDTAWRNYDFNAYFSKLTDNPENFRRTENLFYVICSRTIRNLAVVCLSGLSPEAIANIKVLFGVENYFEI